MAGWRSDCRPMRRSEGAAVVDDIAQDETVGSHAAPVRSTAGEGFDSRDLRNALGTFATGVTIITARGADGGLYGMTANSFTSVSLTPPLVLWSASLYAQSLPAFQEGSHFVVNILAHDQIDLSNKFARTHDNKFAEIDHMIPECGAPVLRAPLLISSAATSTGTMVATTSSSSGTSSATPIPTSRHCCSAAANTCDLTPHGPGGQDSSDPHQVTARRCFSAAADGCS